MEALTNTNQTYEGLNLELSLRPPWPLPPTPPRQRASPRPSSSSRKHSPTKNRQSDDKPKKRHRMKANTKPIEAPYPWATRQRAVVHELEYLRANNILAITGEVKCNECDATYSMEYDLVEKFDELAGFIERNRHTLHDRAPGSWVVPVLPNCEMCKRERCVEPVIPQEEKDHKNINWLFLLLGKMLGRLKLKHLKYFCAQTDIHRTGAKNRLLYLTYFALCKQLQPSNKLFHR